MTWGNQEGGIWWRRPPEDRKCFPRTIIQSPPEWLLLEKNLALLGPPTGRYSCLTSTTYPQGTPGTRSSRTKAMPSCLDLRPAKGELAHPLPYNLLPPPHLAEQVHGRKQGTQQLLYCWA